MICPKRPKVGGGVKTIGGRVGEGERRVSFKKKDQQFPHTLSWNIIVYTNPEV